MMKKSSNKTVYLCGSMTGLKDGGATWRKKLRKWFDKHNIACYDPCIEEESFLLRFGFKPTDCANWSAFPQGIQEAIIKKDLRQIKNRTTYIVCYFTGYSPGTVSELTYAFDQKIPVYMVTNNELWGWVETVANTDGNRTFKTFESLKRFLRKEVFQ